MIALHEQEIERRAWLSTDATDEFSSLSPVDDRDERLPTFAHDDDVLSALGPGDAPWEDTDAEEPPLEDAPTSEMALEAGDPETDNVLAQYFGEVRRFALLSFAEEQALGRRIKRWQRRVRWALYASPVALPTLLRIQQRVEHQGVSLHEIVQQHREEARPSQTAWLAQCRQAIVSLQDLATRLGRLQECGGMLPCQAQERHMRRHERFSLWRAWLTIYEALQLHPYVHEAMREALEDARQVQPEDRALQAAYQTWTRSQRELDQAKTQMMQANLRLVIHVATRFRDRGVPFLDLIQEGNLGLMRAVDKFEPRRGLRFVTYAHWWIRQAISRALGEQYRTIRLPSHVIERKSKLHTAATKLWANQGRAPQAQELSAALGWTPQEVEDLLITVQPLAQLQQPITDDGDALQDVLADTHAPQPDALVAEEQIRRGIDECLVHLTEREAFIVRLRYGLDSQEPHSLQEIGDLLGVSRERVRQLEKQAFAKLRRLQQSTVLAELVQ
jgi:RNA polymerase sigma factor (sigma-70 family)